MHSYSRLAKRRNVPITYQALTNGFAVLLNEAASKPKAAPTRRRRAQPHDDRETQDA